MPSANLQNLDIFYFSSNFNSFSWWVKKKKSYFFSIFMCFFPFNRLCQELQIVYRWIHVQVASWVSLCCQCWFLWEFMSSKLIFMEVYVVKVNFCVSLCSLELILEGNDVVRVDYGGSLLFTLILEGVYLVRVNFGGRLCCFELIFVGVCCPSKFLWEFMLSELIFVRVCCPSWFLREVLLSELIFVWVYVVRVDFDGSFCCPKLILEWVYVVRVNFDRSLCCPSWSWSEFMLSELILTSLYCPSWFWPEFMLSELIWMGVYVVQDDFGVSLCCLEFIYATQVDFGGSLCCLLSLFM